MKVCRSGRRGSQPTEVGYEHGFVAERVLVGQQRHGVPCSQGAQRWAQRMLFGHDNLPRAGSELDQAGIERGIIERPCQRDQRDAVERGSDTRQLPVARVRGGHDRPLAAGERLPQVVEAVEPHDHARVLEFRQIGTPEQLHDRPTRLGEGTSSDALAPLVVAIREGCGQILQRNIAMATVEPVEQSAEVRTALARGGEVPALGSSCYAIDDERCEAHCGSRNVEFASSSNSLFSSRSASR